MKKMSWVVVLLGALICLVAVVQITEARASASCRGTMRNKVVGNTGAPLWALIWAPVSHSCCCSCPAVAGAASSICTEIAVGNPVGGNQTTMCACLYYDAQGNLVVVGFDTLNGQPYCDTQAVRAVANPPAAGALQSQACGGVCPPGKACLMTIEWEWDNGDPSVRYRDEICDCK